MNPNLRQRKAETITLTKGRKMNTSEGNTVAVENLSALPRTIADTHERLQQAMNLLCVLEDFLVGAQPREAYDTEKHPETGVVSKCFVNIAGINTSIEKFRGQLGNIIKSVGAQDKNAPERM